jgi:hypothetical protein
MSAKVVPETKKIEVRVLGRFDKVDKITVASAEELLNARRGDEEYVRALAKLDRLTSKAGGGRYNDILVKGEHNGVQFIGVYRESESL